MDYFYDAGKEESLTLGSGLVQETVQNSDPAIYVKVTSVLFVRAGLFLSHVSSIPSSNIQILIFQNIIDIAVNTIDYALLGYLFSFGKDFGRFIGFEGFLADGSDKNDFAEGWTVVIVVSGLMAAAIGDRISFFASLILNVLVSGIVFPVVMHWTLSESGWMRANALTKIRVSYKDYSYSGLIHMAGGFLALVSMLALNKRLLRFKDMDVCSIPDNGPSLTLFGNFFTIIGFLGIGMPTEKYIRSHLDNNFYGIVLINMLLSAFGSVTVTLLLTFGCPCEPMHKWTSMRSIQAGISGIAVVAGGADVYYPMAAIILGVGNGIVFFLVSFLVGNSRIEDYSNIIACHFVSGFAGTLFPPIFGIREGFNIPIRYSVIHFIWQLICDSVIVAFVFAIFLPLMLLLDRCSILRSCDEDVNHRRAIFAARRLKPEKVKNSGSFDREKNGTAVNCKPADYDGEGNVGQNTRAESPFERVNILFEKKPSPIPGNFLRENQNDSPENGAVETGNEPDDVVLRGIHGDEDAKIGGNDFFAIDHVVNSKPMTFFEEITADSRRPSETAVKNSGDNPGNSRFFEVRFIKGIRHISDSKLFQKFKENMTVPKRRSIWNRETQLKFGSLSNIWVPKIREISVETEV